MPRIVKDTADPPFFSHGVLQTHVVVDDAGKYIASGTSPANAAATAALRLAEEDRLVKNLRRQLRETLTEVAAGISRDMLIQYHDEKGA